MIGSATNSPNWLADSAETYRHEWPPKGEKKKKKKERWMKKLFSVKQRDIYLQRYSSIFILYAFTIIYVWIAPTLITSIVPSPPYLLWASAKGGKKDVTQQHHTWWTTITELWNTYQAWLSVENCSKHHNLAGKYVTATKLLYELIIKHSEINSELCQKKGGGGGGGGRAAILTGLSSMIISLK